MHLHGQVSVPHDGQLDGLMLDISTINSHSHIHGTREQHGSADHRRDHHGNQDRKLDHLKINGHHLCGRVFLKQKSSAEKKEHKFYQEYASI